MTERVFCIKRDSLNKISDQFLDNTDYGFLPRKTKNREDDVEYSREYIQLIPYVKVLLTGTNSTKLIAYRRSGTMSGEKRLEGTWSIGFGGHISIDDCCFMPDNDESYTWNDITKLIYINVIRELYEELHLDPKLYSYEIFIHNTVSYLDLADNEPVTVNDVHACVDVTVRINTNSVAYKEDTAFKAKLMENISLGTMAMIPHTLLYIQDTCSSILSYIKENAKEGIDTDDVITLEKWSENKHPFNSRKDNGSEDYNSLKFFKGDINNGKSKYFPLMEAFKVFGSEWVNRLNDDVSISAIISNKVGEDIYAGEEPIRAPQVNGLTTVATIHEKDSIRHFKNIKKGTYIKVETLSNPTKNYEVGYISLEQNITAKTDDGSLVRTFAVPNYVLICCNT